MTMRDISRRLDRLDTGRSIEPVEFIVLRGVKPRAAERLALGELAPSEDDDHHLLHYADGSGPQMTNLHTLNRRLDRLDSARPIADRRVIRMVRKEGETQADAIARWCSQNPSEPPPDESTDFIILRSIVSPNAKSA